jgi:CRISPR-associated protein Cmr1
VKRLSYQLRFNTPAFLGNAEQCGQWRTPPFKALLRQWWRVGSGITDVNRLREEEGCHFGAANDEGGGSQQSRLRLRLDSWSEGRLHGAWSNDPQVLHPEVGASGRNIGAHLYLGYGPLIYQRGTALKPNAAIQAGESNTLHLAWPGREEKLAELVQLLHWFGTVGGRSRNGWGSLELKPIPSDQDKSEPPSIDPLSANHTLLRRVSRPLSKCLELEWPHALGLSADGRPLIWQSVTSFATWREAMQALAKAKIGFRTRFVLRAPGPFMERHLLAYPVTNHPVHAWGNQARLANQLRFKVATNDEGKLVARILHLPCALPRELAQALGHGAPTPQKQVKIWQYVHDWLDDTTRSGFKRI